MRYQIVKAYDGKGRNPFGIAEGTPLSLELSREGTSARAFLTAVVMAAYDKGCLRDPGGWAGFRAATAPAALTVTGAARFLRFDAEDPRTSWGRKRGYPDPRTPIGINAGYMHGRRTCLDIREVEDRPGVYEFPTHVYARDVGSPLTLMIAVNELIPIVEEQLERPMSWTELLVGRR